MAASHRCDATSSIPAVSATTPERHWIRTSRNQPLPAQLPLGKGGGHLRCVPELTDLDRRVAKPRLFHRRTLWWAVALRRHYTWPNMAQSVDSSGRTLMTFERGFAHCRTNVKAAANRQSSGGIYDATHSKHIPSFATGSIIKRASRI